jgi:cold shock CspA family protein
LRCFVIARLQCAPWLESAQRFTKGFFVLIGKIIDLVHLSQQTHLPGARLVSGHNDKGYGDKGYGVISGDDGQEVYFSHEIIAGLHGFDSLRRGQRLEYTLDEPFLRAATASLIAAAAAPVRGRAA